MQIQIHPLEPFFHEALHNSYEVKLGLNDPEVTGYLARMLCEFSEAENLFKLRDRMGRPIEDLEQMLQAADPVYGTAPSFDAERSVRQYIGDFALFVAGICPEALAPESNPQPNRPTLNELVRIGKESYFIVSQFNVFEFEEEAPLFARLSENFEHCIQGLALMRKELSEWADIQPVANRDSATGRLF